MKNTFITLCLLISLLAQAQLSPLQDHEWQLEKIVIDNEETLAEPDYDATGDVWAKINFDDVGFIFVDLIPGLTYINENSSFTIDGMAILLGEYHNAESSMIFESQFISFGNSFEEWNNPFTYSFREEAEFLYLDIKNSNGDAAIFFTTTLSNTDFEKVELAIYPNPTSSLLHIETNQAAITAIEIFDIQGKSIKQLNTTNTTTIDVSDLANGMYFLKIGTDKGQRTRKFIKK